ncbi:MAG: rhodanese-like domain-containing protein [Hyphomicrobium sp.]
MKKPSARIRGVTAAVGLLLVAAIAGVALLGSPRVTRGPTSLRTTIENVAQRWPEIGHITPAQVAPLMDDRKVVLFDVRQDAEYVVSRLPGAIHVTPGTSRAAFLDRHGDNVKGKRVVFYCSVGERSSSLASRVANDLKARGAVAVDDLAGGIFAWHGEGRSLVDAKGPTEFIHPFDASWGRLVSRQDLIRTEPRS